MPPITLPQEIPGQRHDPRALIEAWRAAADMMERCDVRSAHLLRGVANAYRRAADHLAAWTLLSAPV